MKQALFVFLLFKIAIFSYSQTIHQTIVASEENLKRISKMTGPIYTTNMDELYEGVRGTPYLFNEWKPGNIYLKDNKLIKNVNVKYNIYTDDLLYLNSSSGDSLIIDRSMIEKFEIMDNSSGNLILMEEMNIKPEKNDNAAFVRIIYDGRSKLILKYSKIFIKANYKGPYATGNKYDEYTDKWQYYLITGENTITRIKLCKKSVIKVLSVKESKIKAFVNGQDLSLDNENDVIRVLEYYDSLAD